MIYVDEAIWDWLGLKWCHLVADDTDELHRFALRLGIAQTSYQGPPKTSVPHYDLTGYERRRAIALGAKPCSRQEIVSVLRVVRSKPPGSPHDRASESAQEASMSASAGRGQRLEWVLPETGQEQTHPGGPPCNAVPLQPRSR